MRYLQIILILTFFCSCSKKATLSIDKKNDTINTQNTTAHYKLDSIVFDRTGWRQRKTEIKYDLNGHIDTLTTIRVIDGNKEFILSEKRRHIIKGDTFLILYYGHNTINWENKFLPAILEAWFPSTAAGEVIAETLFGDYNPGGKLSVTFPKTVGQIPLNFPFKPGSQAGQPGAGPNGYGNTRVLGPLYPFGYGLSYTKFEYSNLIVNQITKQTQSDIEVSFNIKNIGEREGDEVVQLYIKDYVSSVTTYESKLRGFDRIHLLPNETKTVKFVIHPDDLAILDKNMNWTVEPGMFKIMIGSSSVDIRLSEDFEIKQ